MSTDLRIVRDHPVNLLTDWYAPQAAGPQGERAFLDTARVLRSYEEKNAVTFAALDNDALDQVREAFSNLHNGAWSEQSDWSKAMQLAEAVSALLGMDD